MISTFQATIQSLAHEGFGFSRMPDGRALFVPFCLPGETVEVRVIQEKKSHCFAEPVAWSISDPARVKPRCRHFGLCGGCHYQHIPYELQTDFKQRIFRETFERIAGFAVPAAIDLTVAPSAWNYRNTLQFRLTAEGHLGFADWMENDLFSVKECHLPMPEIDRAWRELNFDAHAAERVEVRQNAEGDLMIVLHGGPEELPELETESRASILHLAGQDQVVLAGESRLAMRVLGRDFLVSGGAFFQTNFAVTESLVRAVRDMAKTTGCRRLMDLYCGVGLFSAFLADQVEHITAIESSALACDDYTLNLDDHDHIELFQGKVEQVLPHLEDKPDCVILDPPRRGMSRGAAEALLKLSPPAIIYASCNPATLARDARKLGDTGYRLESTTLLDMFPQTYHFECLAFLSKN